MAGCFYCEHGDPPELMGTEWFHANGAAIQAKCTNPEVAKLPKQEQKQAESTSSR